MWTNSVGSLEFNIILWNIVRGHSIILKSQNDQNSPPALPSSLIRTCSILVIPLAQTFKNYISSHLVLAIKVSIE